MLEERRPETAVVTSVAEPAARPAGAFRDPVTWVTAACVFGAYLTLSLYRLWQRTPSSYDLGIYTEYVKQFAHLHAPVVDIMGTGFNLLGNHFQPIVALIAPFFALFPSPATLLTVQALLIAVSVFPVTTAATALLGRGPGRAIGFAYGFSWGLQAMINFDFHEVAFAVPLLAFSLSALLRGRTRAAICWAMPMVFAEEGQGFTLVAIGLLIVFNGRFGRTRAAMFGGAFLAAWGLAWSLLAMFVIIPHFNPDHQYLFLSSSSFSGALGGGAQFSATGLVTQTFHAWPVKLETLVMLLLPTAFIALGSPVALVVLPILGLRFVPTYGNFWLTIYHYNATAMPILFLAAVDVMARWRALPNPATGRNTAVGDTALGNTAPGNTAPGRTSGLGDTWRWARIGAARHGAAMMVAIAVALAFQFPISNLWHASTYRIDPHVAAINAAMAQVPDGATVQATLGELAPLAARTDTFWIGNSKGNPDTQYIVFDGLASGYNPVPANVPEFVGQLFPKAGYVAFFASDDVYVFRRG